MPKLLNNEVDLSQTLSGFKYTTVKADSLGATEYTIVQIMVDASASVNDFVDQLVESLKVIYDACLKHPKAENILLRVVQFNSIFNTVEIHGFLPLTAIDPDIYTKLSPSGGTPLIDTTVNALESLYQYSMDLVARQYLVNSVLFIITDGEENCSRIRKFDGIVELNKKLRSGDPLESFVSILIGINDKDSQLALTDFKNHAEIDQYKSFGDANKSTLAKLAGFVSASVSSSSMSLNGGTSQQVSQAIQQQSLTF